MKFTVQHPDGSTTKHEADAPYLRENEDETVVLTNDRQRLMPRIVRRMIPEGYFVTGVIYQGSLVFDNAAPDELSGAEEATFVVRDETGAKCKVYARVEPTLA